MDDTIGRAFDLSKKGTEQVSIDDIILYLDDVVAQLNETLNADKQVIVRNDGFRLSGAVAKMLRTKFQVYLSQSSTLIEHKYFQLTRNTIVDYFDQLNKKPLSLTDTDKDSLSHMCLMVPEMFDKLDINNSKLIQQLFITKEFIQPIEQIINDISTNGKHLSDDNLLVSLHNLIRVFAKFTALTVEDDPNLLSLVQTTVKCLCSKYYLNTFKNMEPDSAISNAKEHLFLIECPLLVTKYIGKQREHLFDDNYHQIFLCSANEILGKVLSSLRKCKAGFYKAIKYLLEILLMIPNKYYYDDITKIIYHCTIILETIDAPLLDTNLEQQKIDLIKLTISLIYQLASDSKLLEVIQNNKELRDLFRTKLSKSKISHVQFTTEMSMCLLDEEYIKNLPNPQETTKTFVTYLKVSVQDPGQQCESLQLKTLQTTLKGVLENDQVKYQLVEQGGLPILVQCATEEKFDVETVQQPSLENLWTLAFSKDAADKLKSYQDFLVHLRQILKPSAHHKQKNVTVEKAADGLLWKLEGEPQKLAEEKEKKKKEQESSAPATRQRFKYDMMISYQHKDKELCYKIYEHLTKEGNYKVWLDKTEMYGSNMARMAEGIENSEFVLICLSSLYKKSRYCEAEATYAHEKERLIIPLKAHDDYNPDGWLGIIVTGLNRVNFTANKKTFEESYVELIQQIQLSRPPIPPNTLYKTMYIDLWEADDVINFLNDNDFDMMIPILKTVDGRGLHSVYEMCDKNPLMLEQLNENLTSLNKKKVTIAEYLRFMNELKRYIPNPRLSYVCNLM